MSRHWLVIWTILLVGGLLVPQLEGVVLLLAAVRSLRSTKAALEALFVLAFYLLGNRVFTAGLAANLRYLVLFAGFFSVLFRRQSGNNDLRSGLWIFFAVITLSSVFTSYLPTISTLKVVSFFVGAYTMVEGFAQNKRLKGYWFKLVNTYFVFIVISSLAFLFLGLGFERNGRGFQGIMAHPQTFGPILGVISAWFLGLWATGRKISGATVVLSVLSILFIFLSQARTGVLALSLGGILAFLFSSRNRVNAQSRARVRKIIFYLGIVGILFLLINPQVLTDFILPFVQKRDAETTDIGELFNQSRGGLAVSSIDNFETHPILGIGLGVPSDTPAGGAARIKYLGGIPVGASVEKGFLPTAILEELGLVGVILTLSILLIMIKRIGSKFSFPVFWVFLAALFINIGEAVLFSLGGPGFFVWLIFALCYNFDFFKQTQQSTHSVHDLKRERAALFRPINNSGREPV